MFLKSLLLLAVVAVLGLAAWIRLAPDDPAVWNQAIAAVPEATPGPCVEKVTLIPKGAGAACLLPGLPEEVLAKLDATALAQPRTTHLAGTPAEGRITWVARSAVMGFPDYITAEATAAPEGTKLDILSRQRYGSKDMGVNAARLKTWLAAF